MDATVAGYLVGELTGNRDDPLTKLRVLVDEQLRWHYAGCSPGDPADARIEDDPGRRPLCRVGFEAIHVWLPGEQTTTIVEIE